MGLVALAAGATKDTWWVAIVVALISSGALAGGAAGGAKLWRSHVRLRGVKRQGHTFSALVKLHEALESLTVQTEASRCMILRSENGGGIPTPGKSIYSSVIFESDRSPADRIRHRWQRIPVDAQYARLLRDVYEKGEVELVTEKMEPGDLRDVYETSHVGRSAVYRIGCSELAMIYVSICFPDGKELTAGDRSYIRTALSFMQEVFRQHGDIYHFNYGS